MAQDDAYVIMYKILAYLYSCMKKGVKTERQHYCHNGDVLAIPEQYWNSIMQELIDHDYVKGFKYVRTWGGDLVIIDTEPRITLEGIAFLKENSGMQKALKFLQESKSALPFLEPFI